MEGLITIIKYLPFVVFVFGSVLAFFAVGEFLVFLNIKRKKYVDNKKGKIVSMHLKDSSFEPLPDSRLEVASAIPHYTVECVVDGKTYVEEAKRITKRYYWTQRRLADKVHEEVEIKYDYSKDGKIRFYIYEEKAIIGQIILRLLIGLISMFLIYIWFKFGLYR